MKKLNLLSRAEMKNVMGGNGAYDCESWRSQEYMTCFGCCITVYDNETCLLASNCGPSPVVIENLP